MNVWQSLGQGILLGCGLGLMYGFLRPLRPRWLGDLLWIIGLFWSWIYLIFGLCDGDPRMAYSLSLLVGSFLWDALFGRILHPLFSSFWKQFFRVLAKILHVPKKIFKKTQNFLIFLFASREK